MASDSTQKVRAEARGHMKTKALPDPDVHAQIRVSGLNE